METQQTKQQTIDYEFFRDTHFMLLRLVQSKDYKTAQLLASKILIKEPENEIIIQLKQYLDQNMTEMEKEANEALKEQLEYEQELQLEKQKQEYNQDDDDDENEPENDDDDDNEDNDDNDDEEKDDEYDDNEDYDSDEIKEYFCHHNNNTQ